MPVISMFLGIIITMYYDEHNPPRFHAEYQNFKAMFNLDGELLKGDMPPSKIKQIAAWADFHKDELAADWELAAHGEKPYKIDPLRMSKL